VDQLLEATFRAQTTHFWFRGLRRFVRPLLESAMAGRTSPRLLDAGCGTGANLSMLSEFGTCHAFDLNRVGLGYVRGSGFRRLARATVTAIPFAGESFDVVSSFDVLYALQPEDAREALREMARVLKPGGVILVNVAALEILRGGHAVLAEEVRRYNRKLLAEELSGAGLQVEWMSYTNALLFPIVLGARLVQRALRLDTPDETGREIEVPAAPVNAAFDAILAIEAALLRVVNMPFGSSLLCMARKDDRRVTSPAAAPAPR
jgi:SAM-dependent methyltransferase